MRETRRQRSTAIRILRGCDCFQRCSRARFSVSRRRRAAPAAYECPANAFGYVYDGPNGIGPRHEITECRGGYQDLPRNWWDRVESAHNMKAKAFHLETYVPGTTASDVVLSLQPGTRGNTQVPGVTDRIWCHP
ncbi:hypothetical protein [Allokutzneria albata]|uniref:Uncharacterized protein n=1 Tax=Allokutzneria albata TaxID=211114 RepID=A0A1G9RVI5_ALLAB|nr:hypothetical protein [Allokutzneria albata]SDM27269.1 hypothetical protein SAMN04489726_0717 [Allokutzneria albata]